MNRPAEAGRKRPSGFARRRRRPGWLGLLVLLLLAAGAYLYFCREAGRDLAPPTEDWLAEEPVVPEVSPLPEPEETTAAEPEPPPPAETAIELPPLRESDPAVREGASGLSADRAFASWLGAEGLVRRFVAVVDNVADGVSPREHLPMLAPKRGFRAAQDGERFYVAPSSYARYDLVAEAVASLDAEATARLYRRFEPLIDEAYRDLGYPDRRFEDTLRRAIVRLLATPEVEGPVELVPRVLGYAYRDPELESLTDAQKHLLRMGPTNVRRVHGKLREIAAALGIPADQLPRPAAGR